jgi:type VI secretion system ImpA family protein
MPNPPRIDVDALLLPVSPGESLERDAVYFQFRQALRTGDSSSAANSEKDSGLADVEALIGVGKAYLQARSKDLVVAAWMTEALTQTSGFAGLRDGLKLMHGLIAQCWEVCHPPIDDDDDADLRARSIEALASERYLVLSLRRVPLSGPNRRSSTFCALDVGQGPPGRRPPATEADIASGPIFEAIRATPRPFYQHIADDLRDALTTYKSLGAEVGKRFKSDAPDLRALGSALENCLRIVEVILTVKRREEPDAGAQEAPGAFANEVSDPSTALRRHNGRGPDVGQALIDFVDQARALSEAATRLKENRERYATLEKELKDLDAEYAEITARIASDAAYAPLLGRSASASLAPPTVPSSSEDLPVSTE